MLDLDAIQARVDAATEGPWYWRGHQRGPIYLTPHTMRLPVVMGFRRLGMQSAQPEFVLDGLFKPASELAVREVPYRDDIIDIDHPDARFIARARTDIPALLAELRAARKVIEACRQHAESGPEWHASHLVEVLAVYDQAIGAQL